MPRIAVPVALLLFAAVTAAQAVAIPNASFEQSDGGAPAAWQPFTWGGRGEFARAELGHTDAASVRITSNDGVDGAWCTVVPVAMHSRYRLSGWIKTESVTATAARGALLNVHDLQPVATEAVTGTHDWTRVEVEFDTGVADAIQINCLLGGWGVATGTAWFDDIALECLATAPWTPRARIDASAAGEPISPLIYGQFIEHLGRCIQGGIWAEMLEDRKFFAAVGGDGSPWRPIGDAAVAMSGDAPFVGAHSPIVAAAAAPGRGIAQGDLHLVAGRRYVGHAWVAGARGDAAVRTRAIVRLVWGEGENASAAAAPAALGAEFARTEFAFTSGASTTAGRLELTSSDGGELRVGAVSLMPADNVQGLRADTLALLRELDAPVYRWPGGNFVSGYDWRDGAGDRDRRPPRKNPAWQGIEPNDFGIDEFMLFCRMLGATPYVAVNAGLGEVDGAVAELEYCNGDAATPMGALRAQRGHAEPYAVNFWGIGNEMYGDWQLGHVPLARYVDKHKRFAAAMRARAPAIRLVGVGAVGEWSEGMLALADMDLISEHFYVQERRGVAAHVLQVPQAIRRIADAHRDYRRRLPALAGRDIRIALDEWNYWYGPQVYGELGTRYFLKDALGIAAGLHELARQSDLFAMANYAQTVNVIGCIKTTPTAAALETTGLVLKLYRHEFGVLPVRVECAAPLDVMAAFTAERGALTIGAVNPTAAALDVPLELAGVQLAAHGRRFRIAGEPMAANEPGKPPVVAIATDTVGSSERIELAPYSVTLLQYQVVGGGAGAATGTTPKRSGGG